MMTDIPVAAVLLIPCAVLGAAWLLVWREALHGRRLAAAQREAEALNDRLWRLTDSEERYRSLIEAQGDLIVRRDAGRIVYANAAYAALLGLTPEAALGSAAEPLKLACRPAQALEDGARLVDECLAAPEGERWISWVETAVPEAPDRTVLQRVGRDITLRVAAEQALRADRARAESASEAKSRFLATVSHEFRTPLNGILGMADLLGDTALDPEQQTYVGALRSSGEALLSIVDDILDFSKVEAGRIVLDEAPYDPVQLVETVVELMAPRAQEKGLEIAAHLPADLPRPLIGDRDRLRQILLNLLGNAVKFTRSGGVGLRLRCSGGLLVCEVADTGPGVPEEQRERIFQEFEQVETGAAQAGGTGLGLAIVRRLARLMRGDVAVAGRPGGGALFTLTLPLLPTEGAATSPLPDWRGRRIAIVSAAPFARDYVGASVVAAGGEAVGIADAEDVLARFAAGARFDALLVDQAFGREQAARLAGAAREAGVEERLILLAPLERRQFGMPASAGFTGFLIKPVRARSLYERLSPRPLGGRMLPEAAVAPPSGSSAAGSGLSVLVAEDNEINALLATRTLERLGCQVRWARDGDEALRLIEAARRDDGPPFDLALLDIRMPGRDGHEVARLVRAGETQAGACRMPIVALTANAAPADRAAARSAGMDECLAKPLAREALAALVARIAGKAELPLVG